MNALVDLFGDVPAPAKPCLPSSEMVEEFRSIRPCGGFDLIMADPPWKTEMRSEAGLKKSPEAHYPTMPVEEIATMPVELLAAPDCLLWLWTRGAQLENGIRVLKAWGFDLKTMGWWAKMTNRGNQAFGTGYILRNAGEPYLIGTRGAPKTTNVVRETILDLRRENSRKPEKAYREAVRLMPDARRLDLFSRQRREGWTVWGNEVDKFGGDP